MMTSCDGCVYHTHWKDDRTIISEKYEACFLNRIDLQKSGNHLMVEFDEMLLDKVIYSSDSVVKWSDFEFYLYLCWNIKGCRIMVAIEISIDEVLKAMAGWIRKKIELLMQDIGFLWNYTDKNGELIKARICLDNERKSFQQTIERLETMGITKNEQLNPFYRELELLQNLVVSDLGIVYKKVFKGESAPFSFTTIRNSLLDQDFVFHNHKYGRPLGDTEWRGIKMLYESRHGVFDLENIQDFSFLSKKSLVLFSSKYICELCSCILIHLKNDWDVKIKAVCFELTGNGDQCYFLGNYHMYAKDTKRLQKRLK